jgi:hypothetical protein
LVAAAEGLRDLREAVQEGDWEKVDAMVNGESMNASLSPEGLENRNGIDCAAAAEEVREAERQRGRGTERQRGREVERQRDGETERQKDGETERRRNRETEKQRNRETERSARDRLLLLVFIHPFSSSAYVHQSTDHINTRHLFNRRCGGFVMRSVGESSLRSGMRPVCLQ